MRGIPTDKVRALIKLGHACNNDCVFCHAADRSGIDTLDRIVDKVRKARALGAHTVVLSGGEPTLHPALLEIADAVRDHGMHLGLVTNARLLIDEELREALLARGLNYVYVSLHSADRDLHDRLVASRGAFDQTVGALRLLQDRVQNLHINSVITRDNLGSLRPLIDLCATLRGVGLKFTMPQPKGAALANFDTVVPSISQASAAVLDAINYGQRRDDPTRFGHEGFPLCLIAGLEDLQDNLRTHGFIAMSEVGENDFAPIDAELLTHPPCCEPCLLREKCPGIYKQYALRKGSSELRPRLAAAPTPQSPAAPLVSALDDVAAREQASHEQRCWVRLTWGCNNQCLFCLDKETGKSGLRDPAEVRREIIEGRRRGAERLILSGGEATTHPQFLEFVRVGKLAGYRWVQCVSNGRMFSYPQFLERAINAGLDELTVSLHGHTPELHDGLVGVHGAFAQASQGLRAALDSKRIVANVDIVINGRNVEHLAAMLETFASWGVHEFDLLHIIPFGNAWKKQDAGLFYDLDAQAPAIRQALQVAQRCGVRVWLNRFPPEHAEGFESFIQDPHKLHDEVRGRAAEFETWRMGGKALACRSPERCARCYLKRLCDSFEQTSHRLTLGVADAAHITWPYRGRLPILRTEQLELALSNSDLSGVSLAGLSIESLRVRTDRPSKLAALLKPDGTLWGVPLSAIVVCTAEALAEALDLNGTFDIVIDLDRSMAEGLIGISEMCERIVLRQPTYERLSEQHEKDLDPSWFDDLVLDTRTEGIAACLTGRTPEPRAEMLELDALDDEGNLDVQRFTSWFIREAFYVKSLRCRSCVHDRQCAGMHINWVRAHGFAALRPM